VDRATVERWVASYERLWRSRGTGGLGELFTADVSYLASPWSQPVFGLDALAEFWETERVSAAEVFDMGSAVVAIDGSIAVMRVEVAYAASGTHWRDLWVLEFSDDGRCRAFEEWPFTPGQLDGL
jgi:hypothetical protein